MAFSSNERMTFYWWWQEMAAQLDAVSMKFVVQGENGDDCVGIISCAVMLWPNSYDFRVILTQLRQQKPMPRRGHQQPL
jgi:hypothetical protein